MQETTELTPIGLYTYTFKFLPQTLYELEVTKTPHDEIVKLMRDLHWLNNVRLKSFNATCGFKTSELHTVVINFDPYTYIVGYTFPKPEKCPLAKFSAAIINQSGVAFVSLEKSWGQDDWALGISMPNGGHSNFGQVQNCSTIQDFFELITSVELHSRDYSHEEASTSHMCFFKRFISWCKHFI